jgi:hypothetical protein
VLRVDKVIEVRKVLKVIKETLVHKGVKVIRVDKD